MAFRSGALYHFSVPVPPAFKLTTPLPHRLSPVTKGAAGEALMVMSDLLLPPVLQALGWTGIRNGVCPCCTCFHINKAGYCID
jgi:hypothetical protein